MSRPSQRRQQADCCPVGTPDKNVEQPVGEKLRELGLDVDFLRWLEGEAERLPRLDAARKLKPEEFVAAVRAVAFLEGLQHDPAAIAPASPEEWNYRYTVLREFLRVCLRHTGFSILGQDKDLAALEHVLETLLPESSREPYDTDFRQLRRKNYPKRLPPDVLRGIGQLKRPRRGGRPESEQTERMRAAVSYMTTATDAPYDELAEFWNECTWSGKYDGDSIRGRLRKGNPLNREPEMAQGTLRGWQRVYRGDLMSVFPGPFPLSRELLDLWRAGLWPCAGE
jgi:hypothetical protein